MDRNSVLNEEITEVENTCMHNCNSPLLLQPLYLLFPAVIMCRYKLASHTLNMRL